MKNEMTNYEKEMNQEIENRLSLLESESYDFGGTFSKFDWFCVFFIVTLGLAITIYGIF